MADEQEHIRQLREYEANVLGFMAQVIQDHATLQGLDYDNDPKVLRPILDKWMDWHLGASYWITLAKQQLSVAKHDYRLSWQRVVEGVTYADMDRRLAFTGSYEERKVVYEMMTYDKYHTVEVLEGIITVVTDFLWALKSSLDHWNTRRVDSKWEVDRMHRIPGSDYAT